MNYEEARGAVEHAMEVITGDDPDPEAERDAFKGLALVFADTLLNLAESANRIANALEEEEE